MEPPNRWIKCPRKGELISDKFLPFKTPLSLDSCPSIQEGDRFPPSMLGGLRQPLGLVINLTNSDRFYSPKDLTTLGIGLIKIPCEGHKRPPTKEQTKEFIGICTHYFNSESARAVGVHCTHGFNRTGFLIVSYLIQEEFCSLSGAVQLFADARPPGIYKQDYLDELFTRFGDGDECPIAPYLPEWCVYGEETGEVASGDLNSSTGDFIEEVPSIHALPHDASVEVLQRSVQLSSSRNGHNLNFPGSQPVTLDHNRLSHLKDFPYWVSWKADGTRYMLYIQDKGSVYLIRRDGKVFPIPEITFPSRKANDTHHVKETLLDCEMVVEKKQQNVERAYLLIYDLVAFGGDPQFGQMFHSERMKILKCDIYKPREDAAIRLDIDKRREPFSVRLKEFFPLIETGYIYKNYIPKLQHGNDGLIMSREDEGYISGRCDTLLKWKPPSLNSIDFRLKIECVSAREGMLAGKEYKLMVMNDGSRDEVVFAQLNPKDLKKDGFNPLDYDNKIIECTYPKTDKGLDFKMLRQRTDKTKPNTYSTAHNVWKSIQEPLEIDSLLNFISNKSYSAKFGPKPNQNTTQHTTQPERQVKRIHPTNDVTQGVELDNSFDSNKKRRRLI